MKVENTHTTITPKNDYQITVVGGGMVGLTQALLIANQIPTAKVCLVDDSAYDFTQQIKYKSDFDSRSTALAASSVELFDRLGVWNTIKDYATPILRVHISDRNNPGMCRFDNKENNSNPLGYVVENTWLIYCLANAVISSKIITLYSQATVSHIQPVKDGACIRLDIGSNKKELELRSELVIIVDGVNSSLRQKLGIDIDVYDYKQHALVANVSFDRPHRGVAYERFTDDGPMAMLPLGYTANANTAAMIWTRPDGLVEPALKMADSKFLKEIQLRFGYRLGAFTRVGKRVSYPLKLILAKEQVRKSIVLMGNAAHFLHPVAGQGFNLAVRDCAQLTSVLRDACHRRQSLASLAVLNRYLKLQEADQFLTIQISHGFTRVFSNNNSSLVLARSLGLACIEYMPKLSKEFFDHMMGRGFARANLLHDGRS